MKIPTSRKEHIREKEKSPLLSSYISMAEEISCSGVSRDDRRLYRGSWRIVSRFRFRGRVNSKIRQKNRVRGALASVGFEVARVGRLENTNASPRSPAMGDGTRAFTGLYLEAACGTRIKK